MNENNDMQKRMLIMTLVVFVFFIAYEFLVLKPQKEARQAQVEQEQKTQKSTPKVQMSSSSTSNMSKSVNTLSSKSVATTDIVVSIKTAKNIIQLDKLGRVIQVVLTEEKYKDENNEQIKLFDPSHLRPLEVRFVDGSVNNQAFEKAVEVSSSSIDARTKEQKLRLTQKLDGTTLTKDFVFYPDGHYDLKVSSTNDKKFFITNGSRPDVLADMYAVHGLITQLSDGTLQTIEDGDAQQNVNITGANFVSSFDRYYTSVAYNFQNSFAFTVMPNKDSDPEAFIHAGNSISFSGFMGPKNHKDLVALNPELVNVIDYGWFTFIAKPMFSFLQFIHNYIGNWGWSIVILTILIKLVLYPLSYKGMVSMQKLKDLAPKMKEIQTKYKDDKQKQSMHMMELYKKHGANPMGGCLPLILQIPVFFAIYRVLLNAIELKGAPWILWIKDLAEMDPYFVLPILMGATMFLQQKITPNTMQDEMQKKIFQMLPLIFTFFFLWFPAGLTLYWFINNLFTIGQQYYINKLFEKRRTIKK